MITFLYQRAKLLKKIELKALKVENIA